MYLKNVYRFFFLINGEARRDVDDFLSKDRTLDEYKHYITKYHEIFLAIRADIRPTAVVGIFRVNFTEIINVLCDHADKLKRIIIVHVKSVYQRIKNE